MSPTQTTENGRLGLYATVFFTLLAVRESRRVHSNSWRTGVPRRRGLGRDFVVVAADVAADEDPGLLDYVELRETVATTLVFTPK